MTKKQQLASVSDWAVVDKVIDGDTLHLKEGRKIRILGIDTAEIGRRGKPSQEFARKAYITLKQLVKHNSKVGLSYDQQKKDRYKRTLAYVILEDGRSVAQILLAKGLAYSIVIPPNDAYIICYRLIEAKARKSRKGLWQLSKNQWLDAESVTAKTKGLRFIRAIVLDYHESQKSIFLKLSSKLSIRIAKKDQKYFPEGLLKSLPGKAVRLRGWISAKRGRKLLYIRSAYDIRF